MLDAWSREGAEAIGRRIRAFWLRKGFVVRYWVVKQAADPRFQSLPRFDVRTDMVNGFPIRRLEAIKSIAA